MSKREERRIGLSLLPTELAQLVQLLTNKHLDGENLFNSQDIFYISPELVEYYADHFHIDYRGRLYEFPPGESEVERIEAKMSDQTFVRDREQMAKNFQYVVDALHKKRYDGFDFVSRLKNIFIDVKAEQIERMGRSDQFSEDEIQDEKKLLESLRRDQALFTHLRESTQSTKNALNSLEAIRKRRETPPQISEQETPRLLTTRQQLLLTKVAVPLHDLAKLLGSTKQIDPDHENAMQFLLEKFGVGQMIPGKKGQEGILTQDDVEFISLFISSHEDIYRERWFEELAKGFGEELDTTKVNDPVAIDRAVSFFHIFDIFGNAAKIIDKGNGTGTFTIDFEEGQDGKSEFDKRFLDLYQRHMYLDDVGGWNKGKAWRPEWGVYAIRSVINTVRGLEQFGVKMEEGLIEKVRSKLVNKLQEARIKIEEVGKEEEWSEKVKDIENALSLIATVPGETPTETGEVYEWFANEMKEKKLLKEISRVVGREHGTRTQRVNRVKSQKLIQENVEKLQESDPDTDSFIWYNRNITAFLTILQLCADKTQGNYDKDCRPFIQALADGSVDEDTKDLACRTVHGLWYATQLFRGTEDRGDIFDRLTEEKQQIDMVIIQGVARFMIQRLYGEISLERLTQLFGRDEHFGFMIETALASDRAYKDNEIQKKRQFLKDQDGDHPKTDEEYEAILREDDPYGYFRPLLSPEQVESLQQRTNAGLTQDDERVRYLLNGVGFSTLQEAVPLIVKETGMHPVEVLEKIKDDALDPSLRRQIVLMEKTQYMLGKSFAGEASMIDMDSVFNPEKSGDADFIVVQIAASMTLEKWKNRSPLPQRLKN